MPYKKTKTKQKNITDVHLETKQSHRHILRYVSASCFQLNSSNTHLRNWGRHFIKNSSLPIQF